MNVTGELVGPAVDAHECTLGLPCIVTLTGHHLEAAVAVVRFAERRRRRERLPRLPRRQWIINRGRAERFVADVARGEVALVAAVEPDEPDRVVVVVARVSV